MRLLTVPIVAVFSSVTTNWYWLGQRHRVAEVESQRAARVVAADREQVSARLARFKAELEESRGRVAELEAALAKQESPDVELDSDAQVEADEALQRRVAELEAMLVESRARILEAAAAPPLPPVQAEAGAEAEGEGEREADVEGEAIDEEVVEIDSASALDVAEQVGTPLGRIGQSSGQSDPVTDIADAAWRLQVLVKDMAVYAVDASLACLWQWPVDNTTASWSTNLVESVEVQLSLLVSEISTHAQPAVAYAEQVHGEMSRQVQDVAGALSAQLPPDVLVHVRALDASTRDVVADLATELDNVLGATRASFDMVMQSFLEQHPQHRSSIAGHDPLFVFFLFLAGVVVIAYDTYLCAKVAAWSVSFALQAACSALCCSRRGDALATDGKVDAQDRLELTGSNEKVSTFVGDRAELARRAGA